MRIIDLHCYPNTEPWIKSQDPYVEALAKYWNRPWTAKTEPEVIEEFKKAAVEAVLVAFDIETVTNTPPCSNEYVAKLRDANLGVIRQAWAAADPLKGDAAIEEAKTAIKKLGMFGSDYPSIPHERLFREWKELGYPDALMEKIFHANAERILGL